MTDPARFMRRRRLTDAEIVARYQAGESSPDIAIRANCSADYVIRAVRAAGVAIRPPRCTGRGPKLYTLTREEAVARYVAGETLAQVGEAAGASGSTVRRWLEAAGVKTRGYLDYRSRQEHKRRRNSPRS